jgi:hypothetical protein
MSLLDATARATLERWVGSIEDGDVEDVEARLVRLGPPSVVALELLLIRAADLEQDPSEMRIDGDGTFKNVSNVDWLKARIGALSSVVAKLPGLNVAAKELLDQADAFTTGRAARFVDYEVGHVRPGG